MPSSPGTVSKILWHFTGGPRWDSKLNKQEPHPKPAHEAYNALISILKDRELRIGGYKEVIKVKVPVIRIHDEETDTWSEEIGATRQLISVPVCCVADIPIIHLGYHADRYGKFAIGFHRASAIRHGFNPVFYQLHHSKVLLSIYAGITYLGDANDDIAEDRMDDVLYLLKHLDEDADKNKTARLADSLNTLSKSVKSSAQALRRFLAFVKTFDEAEFSTIYTEREWRSIRAFKFEYDDISMIAVPRSKGDGDYFERFVEEARSIPIPPTVSIVAWDDLVEH
jgi:hypothetical protein